MLKEKYIFSQITKFIPRYQFEKFIKQYNGNKKIRVLSCHDQFLAMMFGQPTNLKSLRGIVVCLNAHINQLYHLGFRLNKLTLSTLSRANEVRN
ncbi:MAG: DUF4372 domain-containing protein [Candidatus Moranbacteria bacterium]|nr:DUF4372 domain-containing protein [Candidatus Moranbacteria bacterium]